MPRIDRPTTAPDAVVRELRRRILSGEIPPGAPLRQEALAEDFGVSRIPVREALRTLASEGHVTYATHRGFRVVELSVADLEDCYHLRGLIEDDLAARAMATGGPRYRDDVTWAHEELNDVERRRPDAALELAARNRHFHWTVLRPTPRASRILTGLWDASEPYRARWFASPEHVAAGAADHLAIRQAVMQGDAEALVARLRAHREAALEALRAVLPG
jgi:DNA-binding GntR family transcriptional regulator